MKAPVDPVSLYARWGLWAMPAYALLLGAGTITHQPAPQDHLADWSRYVTTNEFLISHMVTSIGGAVFGALGAVAFGVKFMQRGSVRLGLWGMVTGVAANVVTTSIFGVAAFTQPAIGRFYLAGHQDLAQGLYYDAAQGTPLIVMALLGLLLLVSSFVIFGVAVARSADLPRIAGIGFAASIVLFAVIGFAFDNWIQSIACALMISCAVWIVIALSRPRRENVAPLRSGLAGAEAQ